MEREFPIDGNGLLEEAVAAAAEGESVVLTRDGRPVATVHAKHGRGDPAAARMAVQRIIERGKRLSLEGTPIRDLIDEGRK